MQTSLLSNAPTTAAPSSPTANAASVTSDMFTKLLVAQIQNQDPTAPTDPSTYVNQLTQLSQTESLQNMANLTSGNASILQSLQVLALGAQVGSSVTASTSTVKVDTAPVQGSFTLGSGSSTTSLVLTGVDGQKHTLPLGVQAAGDVPFTIDPAALGLAPGSYTMDVVTASGEKPALQVAGLLSSVKLASNGSVVVNMSNVGEISPSAISSFNGQPTPTPH